MWRIRLSRNLPRYMLYTLAVWGVLASARYAVAPPKPAPVRLPHIEIADRAGEGFAALFARRYLTWNAASTDTYRRELEPFLGSATVNVAMPQLPRDGEQQVLWTEVVQSRELESDERVYTVAAQTDTAGLLYLTVSVLRHPNGTLALAGYPAFVGAPNSAGLDNRTEHLQNVEDSSLTTVVQRALRNYLEGAVSDLAADLTSQAQVSLPGMVLKLQAVSQLKWLPSHESVFAIVQAADERGAQYTLTYELDVSHVQARWEISAIQMNPAT